MLNSRQQRILELCKEPKTVSDLSEELSIGYHTARRELLALVELKVISETPWRIGREKGYRTTFELSENSKIDKMVFAWAKKSLSAQQISNEKEILGYAQIAAKIVQLAALKPLWEWHVKNDAEQLHVDGHPSKEIVKDKLQVAIDIFDNLKHLAEQLLMAPIWDDDQAPKLLIGNDPVDWSKVQEKIRELEQFALDRGW